MRNTRKVLGLGLTAILAVSLTAGSAFAADDTVYRNLDEIKESGTINIGVFSDSGHYVLITGIEDDIISVLDPMYRPGRFDKPGRREKVRMDGNTAYAHWTVIRDDCRERPFFLFSKP